MKNSVNLELILEQKEKPVIISRLINSIYYFIEFVFLITENEGFRLVAIHQGKLLTDETYKTAKGAKIAFLKFWGYRAWKERVKPKWSHFYPPDSKWLKEKKEMIRPTD